MQPDSEDDAWRSIVEHYGERVPLDPEDPPDAEWGVPPLAAEAPRVDPGRVDPGRVDPVPVDATEERFVPPPPPPLPRLAPDRLLAWAGVFGAPAVLLFAVVTGIHLPGWLGYLLAGGFVGGFVYLVSRMPRGPRDPADDGARL